MAANTNVTEHQRTKIPEKLAKEAFINAAPPRVEQKDSDSTPSDPNKKPVYAAEDGSPKVE